MPLSCPTASWREQRRNLTSFQNFRPGLATAPAKAEPARCRGCPSPLWFPGEPFVSFPGFRDAPVQSFPPVHGDLVPRQGLSGHYRETALTLMRSRHAISGRQPANTLRQIYKPRVCLLHFYALISSLPSEWCGSPPCILCYGPIQ